MVIDGSPLIGIDKYSRGWIETTFFLHVKRESYISRQTILLMLFLACSRLFQFDVVGSKVYGLVLILWRFAHVELEKDSLLIQEILIDLQK